MEENSIRKGVLVKYGEIALRGKNRYIYENILVSSIEKNLAQFGGFSVRKEQGRLFVSKKDDFDNVKIAGEIAKVFGVCAVCPCLYAEDMGIEKLRQMARVHVEEKFGDEPFTFKFESKRADKRYPLTSNQISPLLGEYILDNFPKSKVDVHKPDAVINVELRGRAYVYSTVIDGNGGLPPNSAGVGVLLLSGGFDSPVAGFLAAKRGIEIVAAYFHSPPYTSGRALEKVKDLAEHISKYTGKFTLYSVPFTEIQLYLRDGVQAEKLTILLKRTMLRTAQKIAEKHGAYALITGDSVGQVASQTLRSIYAVDSATLLPVLRPLACFDKREIIDLARKIGTYDISVRPYDDCCTLFVADHPETKPKRHIIERIESKLDRLNELIEVAVENSEVFAY